MSFAANLISLLLIIQIIEVKPLNLILHPVGKNDDNLVVFDMDGSRTFCYPNLEEETDVDHEHMPTRDRDHGLDPFHKVTQLKNNARVICREVSGYTHLERVYPVPAPPKLPKSNKRVKWMAECIGYEPLLSYCFTFNVSDVDSKCENLLGIKCGHCSKKFKLKTGESIAITNPEYPNYSDDVICEWHFEMPVASVVEVNFSEFALPPRNEKGYCHRGSLDISGVSGGSGDKKEVKTIQTMCGSALPDPITFSAKGALIRFYSGLFIPRPTSEQAGFNLTVTAIRAVPVIPTLVKDDAILNLGEILAIFFACSLIVFVAVFVCYLVRRYLKEQRRTLRRHVMEERLATQRRGRQEVALTTMLASRLQNVGACAHQRHQCPPTPRGDLKDFPCRKSQDVSKREVAFRTTSSQPRGHHIYHACPPAVPTKAPPPPPIMQKQRKGNSPCRQTFSPESCDEPDYMEPETMQKSLRYLHPDNLNNNRINRSSSCSNNKITNNGRMPSALTRPRLSSHASARPTPAVRTSQDLSHSQGTPTNNLGISVKRPNRRPKVSLSAHNVTSCDLNLWPSTSSLAPSNKTVPLTPSKEEKTAMHCNFPLKSWNTSSTIDSFSFQSGTLSPFPGRAPDLCQSKLSQLSMCVLCNFTHSQRSISTSSDNGNKCWDQSRNLTQDKSSLFGHVVSANYPCKSPEPGDFSFDSNDSVFVAAGESNCNVGPYREGAQPKCLCQSQGHLSKSCGDVSPGVPFPKRDPILEDLNQSLPGDQSSVANIVKPPFLRRVSQMFLGSGSLHTPGLNVSRTPTPKMVKNQSSSHLQEPKIPDKNLDARGTGHRRFGTRATSESSQRKVALATSPRKQPSSSVSSASFMHYKYNRLEKISNADLDALLPASKSRENSYENSSPTVEPN
ncbi:uncharacterized protein [Macrobrachium rosenbergii]|uniref:uncharacterized protein isoform X2 n=1 Tax=Macrobrachium rosenbergii TaxID=79674 RepID=UPI0034D6E00B